MHGASGLRGVGFGGSTSSFVVARFAGASHRSAVVTGHAPVYHLYVTFDTAPVVAAATSGRGTARALALQFEVRGRPGWFDSGGAAARAAPPPRHLIRLARRCGTATG